MTYKKFAQKAIFILAIAALFTPLLVWNGTLYPFGFGKVWLFRLIVEAMAVLYIPLALAYKECRPKRSLLWVSAGIFLASLFISGLLGAGFYKSFWSNAERMEGLFGMLHYVAWALILAGTFLDLPNRFRVLFSVFLGVGIISIIESIFKILDTGYLRLEGPAGNPAYLASYLLFAMLFAAFLAQMSAGKTRLLYWSLGVICAGGVFATGTRGAFVGLAAGVFLYGALMLFGRNGSKRLRLLFGGVLLLLLLGGMWVARVRNISLQDSNVRSRLTAMGIGIKGWQERPMFGWGPENFNIAFNKYIDTGIIREITQRQWFDRAHNKLIDMLVMGGVLGIAAYMFFFGALWRQFWRLRKINAALGDLGLAGLAAYFVQNLFFFDTFQSYLPLFLLIGFIAVLGEKNGEQALPPGYAERRSFSLPISTSLLLCMIAIAPIVYIGSIKPVRAAIAVGHALSLDPVVNKHARMDISEDLRYRAIVGEYLRAISYESYLDWEATLLFERYYVGELRAGSVPFDAGLLGRLAEKLKQAAVREPMKYEIYLAHGEVLNIHASSLKEQGNDQAAVGLYKEASVVLDKALEFAPYVPRVWYAKGALELGLGNKAEGIEAFKNAVELNPAIAESHITLAAAYLLLGDHKNAAEAFDQAIEHGHIPVYVADFELLIKVYLGAGIPEKVQKAAELNADHLNSEQRLAVAYLNLQYYPDAAASFDKAIEFGYIPKTVKEYQDLFIAYSETMQYEKVEKAVLALIGLEPKNARWHAVLAATYKGMHRYDDARAEVKKAVEMDASFAQEAEVFLKTLEK